MQLTPIDIRNKDFHKGMRGYQCEEVEKFLDNAAKEFEIVYAENFDLKEKIAQLENQLGQYRQIESTLQQTMILAQQTAEEVKQAARHEADLLLREAEQQKDKKLAEAEEKREEIQNQIQELLRKKELVKSQLKSYLHAHLEMADNENGISIS